MSRSRTKPAYVHHRPSGQARVRINRVDHYLGIYGSKASRERYDELIAEWFDSGDTTAVTLTIDDLCLRFQEFCDGYYLKNGEPTNEPYNVRLALRPLIEGYGNTRAKDFGPKALKAVRQSMIDAGNVRTSINRMIGRVRRMFRWAVSEELLPATVYQALATLPGLRAGRSGAVESVPVKPVSRAWVDAIRPHVSRQVWALVELQWLTGARAGELLIMRGCDLNTSGTIWEYTPSVHKMEHKGRERLIFIGPRAQAIVREFLKADLQAYLFSPADAWEEHLAERRSGRKTPTTPSQQARQRKAKLNKQPGDRYTVCSYGQAIRTACKKAGVPHWHSHQLRHAAGTTVRREFGLEASRVMLGHASSAITEVYAEMDAGKARAVAAAVG